MSLALVGAGFGFLMTRPTPRQRAAGNLDTADVIDAHAVGVPDGATPTAAALVPAATAAGTYAALRPATAQLSSPSVEKELMS